MSLIAVPEGINVGQAINDGIRAIETDNPGLSGIPPPL
jgi:hypothetical protein